jgi:hypothetical protein
MFIGKMVKLSWVERACNIPVSKFMDRHDTNIGKCQIGFIDILVTPLYETWRKGLGDTWYNRQCLENIAMNRRSWEILSAESNNAQSLQKENFNRSRSSSRRDSQQIPQEDGEKKSGKNFAHEFTIN